jgi:topoisomerase IV subunit A
MRLRNLRKLEEMEIKGEHKALTEEQKSLEKLMASPAQQWKTVGNQIKDVREKYGPTTAIGKRRTHFEKAPDAEITEAVEQAMVEREPITVVVSKKGWIRALRGHQQDLASLVYKGDDTLDHSFFTETTAKILVFSSNGRFYTIEAAKLPGGRGHGEPIRLFADMDQTADVIDVFPYVGKRKFIVASRSGNGFIVNEDDVLGTTRKGKQVLNVKAPDRAAAIVPVQGDTVATIGENRKMVLFPLTELPEMGRGRGVRLQRYKEGGLSDVTAFELATGMTWLDGAQRTFTLDKKELSDWRGKRADAGRLAPKGFPKTNKFR